MICGFWCLIDWCCQAEHPWGLVARAGWKSCSSVKVARRGLFMTKFPARASADLSMTMTAQLASIPVACQQGLG